MTVPFNIAYFSIQSCLPYHSILLSNRGLDGFRLFKANLTKPGPSNPKAAYRWQDTVAIGQYFYADIHKMVVADCPYPSYLTAGAPVLPYYIPFRALTVQNVPNLLVAGKSLAASFYANAAIRLHPEEWSTGVAAGAAAAVMFEHKMDTSAAFANVALVQDRVLQLGSPLEWTGL